MKEETIGEAVLREFLLGGLDDEQRDQIETQLLTDSQTRERILAAEQDLIEDYLEGSLTNADREKFISLYARTSEERRKLRITRSIKDWAIAETALPQKMVANVSSWDRLRNWLRLRPALVPIAVAIIVAIVVAAVWLTRRIDQRNRQSVIEQELVRLNSPASMRGMPGQMIQLPLSPVAFRSMDKPVEITTRENVRVVELVLFWIQKERYSKYQAEVRCVDCPESYMIGNLQPDSDGDYAIRVRVLAQILKKGQYRIELTGVAPDGSVGLSEEYTFTVRN
ncbi:MAG TPA: hypothetical protein VN844_08860 [Pyrinomonadaceae bacterium]|nr:hypothetical protein [Pyrinomonadaceae bacterium]